MMMEAEEAAAPAKGVAMVVAEEGLRLFPRNARPPHGTACVRWLDDVL
jgi:hypothetical protein